MPLPCAFCRRELGDASADGDVNLPSGGTVFTSSGNFGSTVWDPMSGGFRYLEITVCDSCLMFAAGGERVLERTRARTDDTCKTWHPGS